MGPILLGLIELALISLYRGISLAQHYTALPLLISEDAGLRKYRPYYFGNRLTYFSHLFCGEKLVFVPFTQ